jgi:arsenate reductase
MKLLFVCTGNSCRSQMAEGWARAMAQAFPALELQVSSAGLEAHGVNPRAISTMATFGIDISSHSSDVLSDSMVADADVIVTVCAHADANCPLIPPHKMKIHLPFDDPAQAEGSEEDIKQVFTRVCGEIRQGIKGLLDQLSA